MDKLTEEQKALVLDNLNLVRYIINKKIYRGSDEFEDLFQEGCLYLCMAARDFNPDLGFKFGTYAGSTVYGGLRRYKRDKSSERRGIHLGRVYNDIRCKAEKVIHDLGLNEDDYTVVHEVLEELGLGDYTPLSISSLQSEVRQQDENTTTLADIIPDKKDDYSYVECELTLKTIVAELENRCSEGMYSIIVAFVYNYLEDGVVLNQAQLADLTGHSQSYVSRVLVDFRKLLKLKLQG